MDFDAIAVFVKVVETGSFSNAAKLLKMPKTTVSGKVAALERRLGVTLIQRTTRRLHITEAGQTYFRHCTIALREVELAESALLAGQEKPSGKLKITAPVDIGHTVLPKVVDGYLARYPEVEVELVVTNRTVDLIAEGIDLAIRIGALKDSTLIAKKYFETRSVLYASPSYLKKHGTPSHPRELAQHHFIQLQLSRIPELELTDGKSKIKFTPKSNVTSDDLQTNKALAIIGRGITWLPSFMATREVQGRELVEVLPKWRLNLPGIFWFIHPGQKYASAKVRSFIDFALENPPN